MALQYTYLAHASPCAWVEKGKRVITLWSSSLCQPPSDTMETKGSNQTGQVTKTEPASLPGRHEICAAFLFQTSLWRKRKGWSRFSAYSRLWMFSIWGHKISLSWPRENLPGADTVPKRSTEALINPSMCRPQARRKILISSTGTWLLSS